MVVLGCLAIALLVSVPAGFRVSTVLIAATFAVAVVLRLTVRDAGVLAIRSRAVDVGMFLVFGVVVLLLGLSVPDPVIDLPWVPHRTG